MKRGTRPCHLQLKKIIWIVQELHQLIGKDIHTLLSTDNKSVVDLTLNPIQNVVTRNIDISYHITGEK